MRSEIINSRVSFYEKVEVREAIFDDESDQADLW